MSNRKRGRRPASKDIHMKLNDALRLLAGFMVLLSLVLTVYADSRFIWLTAFVGVNLLQSAFTKWCPAIWLFKKFGLKEC